MRQQHFLGYVKDYLKDISGLPSLNIHKLSKLLKKNYRIKDSLIVYCVLANKKEILNKYTKNEYALILRNLDETNILDYSTIDYDFKKIWDSYQNKMKYKEHDDVFKTKLRSNILQLMEEKGISKYRIYSDLNLNPGNINAYLKNNDCGKVSSETAKKIYRYVVENK